MRMLKMSGIALAAGLAGCAHHAAEAPPPTVSPSPSTSAVPVGDPPPPPAAPTPMAAPVQVAATMGTGWDRSDEESSASLREHHRHHHNGGVTAFITMSLDTLNVDENQRVQIEQIRGTLWQAMAPAREAEQHLMTALADGVAMGTVDTARIDTAVMKVSRSASEAHNTSVDSLNKLHAILTPVQRQVLADKVQAHWQVWRNVNHDEAEQMREPGGRLATLADELNLSPDQVEKIAMKMKGPGPSEKFDPSEADAHVTAFTNAFASDTFDASKFGNGAMANGHMAAHGARRMVRFYAAVTPVLTPAQRTALADDLRDHGNHHAANAMN